MSQPARKPRRTTRNELCLELLEIERDNAGIFSRIDAIKTELKLHAVAVGKFRETFVGLGYVSVSPATPEEVTGEAPVIVVPAWSALKAARQEKLIADGLVRIEAIVKGASYGQVRTKLHAQPNA